MRRERRRCNLSGCPSLPGSVTRISTPAWESHCSVQECPAGQRASAVRYSVSRSMRAEPSRERVRSCSAFGTTASFPRGCYLHVAWQRCMRATSGAMSSCIIVSGWTVGESEGDVHRDLRRLRGSAVRRGIRQSPRCRFDGTSSEPSGADRCHGDRCEAGH